MKTAPIYRHELIAVPRIPLRRARLAHPRQGLLSKRITMIAVLSAGLFLGRDCLALAGSWISVNNLKSARLDHATTLLNDGTVLIEGGSNGNGAISSAEIYDPSRHNSTLTGLMNFARLFQSATLMPDGRVLIAGGSNYPDTLATAEFYDPATKTWSLTGSLNVARAGHGAILFASGQVLVAGGSNGSSRLASCELFDPATENWSLTGSMSVPRSAATYTLLPNGKVLAAGGQSALYVTEATAELYDPATGMWTPTGSLNFARAYHTATLLPDGKVLVAGGAKVSSLNSAELYDPATGEWTLTGNLITARKQHTAVLQPDGTVLIAAGLTGVETATAELYDPATGSWSQTAALAQARYLHTMTLLSDGTTMVAGGDVMFGEALNSVEIYTPGFAEGTRVSGNGAVAHEAGAATFDIDLTVSGRRPVGYLTFIDLNAGVSFSRSRIRSLTISGNTATVRGAALLDNHDGKVTFTAVFMDNSTDGTTDTFSITMSNGYSASGTLTGGNVTIE